MTVVLSKKNIVEPDKEDFKNISRKLLLTFSKSMAQVCRQVKSRFIGHWHTSVVQGKNSSRANTTTPIEAATGRAKMKNGVARYSSSLLGYQRMIQRDI